jgi:hypothetical protein
MDALNILLLGRVLLFVGYFGRKWGWFWTKKQRQFWVSFGGCWDGFEKNIGLGRYLDNYTKHGI